MDSKAEIFKDDTLRGISMAIKNLEYRETQEKTRKSITKENVHFCNLLNYLDFIFSFGLKDPSEGYWVVVKKIAHISVVEIIEKHKLAKDGTKKSHLWLYHSFVENSLPCYVRMLVDSKSLKNQYKSFALLRDVKRCKILINLLAEIETLHFSIDIDDPYLQYGQDTLLNPEFRISPQHSNSRTIQENEKTKHQIGSVLPESPSIVNEYRYTKKVKKKKNKSIKVCPVSVPDSPVTNIDSPNLQRSTDLAETQQIDLQDSQQTTLPSSVDSSLIPSEGSFELKDDDTNLSDSGINEEIKDLGEELRNAEMLYMNSSVEGDSYSEEEFNFYRADSFDRFCRRNTLERNHEDPDVEAKTSLDIEDAGLVEEAKEEDGSATPPLPPTRVAPQISQSTLRKSSISKSSIDKMNDLRYDTNTGILLPTLPRRPGINDAASVFDDVNISNNILVMISVEILQQPTETVLKVFKVRVGHLAGYGAPFYLLISNFSVYLLKTNVLIGEGEEESLRIWNLVFINLDSVNKVQSGLNFQDVYIFHDRGCLHVSTGNEIVSRAIISMVKGAIKSIPGEQQVNPVPMASNTYNELEQIIQDWLICSNGVQEPEILHFSLIHYSALASEKHRKKVRKVGEMFSRHTNFGLISYWEKSFFALRGHMLYEYNEKRTDFKHKYDLSVECGGCIKSGCDDGMHVLKIIGTDGSKKILEIGVYDENVANDWLMSICQVVADAKMAYGMDETETLVACGLVLTPDKIYLFNQDSKSGRLVLEDSCPTQNIIQVFVDNHRRNYCVLSIDHELEHSDRSNKSTWLFEFENEFELGKFEQTLNSCWHNIYQVSLQFVLLADQRFKNTIASVLHEKGQNYGNVDKDELYALISN